METNSGRAERDFSDIKSQLFWTNDHQQVIIWIVVPSDQSEKTAFCKKLKGEGSRYHIIWSHTAAKFIIRLYSNLPIVKTTQECLETSWDNQMKTAFSQYMGFLEIFETLSYKIKPWIIFHAFILQHRKLMAHLS